MFVVLWKGKKNQVWVFSLISIFSISLRSLSFFVFGNHGLRDIFWNEIQNDSLVQLQ